MELIDSIDISNSSFWLFDFTSSDDDVALEASEKVGFGERLKRVISAIIAKLKKALDWFIGLFKKSKETKAESTPASSKTETSKTTEKIDNVTATTKSTPQKTSIGSYVAALHILSQKYASTDAEAAHYAMRMVSALKEIEDSYETSIVKIQGLLSEFASRYNKYVTSFVTEGNIWISSYKKIFTSSSKINASDITDLKSFNELSIVEETDKIKDGIIYSLSSFKKQTTKKFNPNAKYTDIDRIGQSYLTSLRARFLKDAFSKCNINQLQQDQQRVQDVYKSFETLLNSIDQSKLTNEDAKKAYSKLSSEITNSIKNTGIVITIFSLISKESSKAFSLVPTDD